MKVEKVNTVLVVDDDQHIRELVKDNLEDENYRVYTAENGLEAKEILEKISPQLVVLDVMMPEMDGWEVCKLIRDSRQMNNIKIIMLTARSTGRDQLIGLHILKADKYITKPFDIEYLLSEVKKLLEEK